MSDIIKPIFDKQNYKYFIFDNKMKVILIENKNITFTGCTLLVDVGFMYDTIDGIAHFLEHMLFMGSEKYPKENSFSERISSSGGFYNAFTSYDKTGYHFICDTDHFNDIFDIFINFFIHPLFDENSISREINAVDAEHNKNVGIDSWRLERLIELIGEEPLNKFHTGSKKTLNVKDIRKYVIDFFEKYYSSNIMNIVIMSPKPFDEIEKIITEPIKLIKNKNIKMETFGQLYKTPKAIKFNTVSKDKIMTIFWNYCYSSDDLLYNVPTYLMQLLSSESIGTLIYILKKNELISDHFFMIENKYNGSILIKLNFQLTSFGYNKINEIINTTFDYIEKIKEKGINNKYYDQFRNINNYKFLFSDNEISLDHLVDISIILSLNLPTESLLMTLSGCYIYEYNKTIELAIKKICNYLTSNNCIIIINSENDDMLSIDPIFKLKYTVYIKSKSKTRKNKKKFKVSLPKLNPFVVDKITMDKSFTEFHKLIKYPEKIHDEPSIYFKNHSVLPLPFIIAECFALTDWFYKNIHNNMTSKMFILCMINQLQTFTYDLKMSLYNVSFNVYKNMFSVLVYGSFNKIKEVIDSLLEKLCEPIDKKIFESTKKCTLNELQNYKYIPAYDKIKNYFISSFDETEFSIDEKIQELQFISYDDVSSFITKLKKDMKPKINIYIQGNIEKDDALLIGKKFTKLFDKTETKYKCINTIRELENKKIVIINENKDDINYDVLYCCPICHMNYQHSNWDKILCCIDILFDFVNEKFFNTLRTKKQLGYIVKCQKITLGNKQYPFKMFGFLVQSPNTPCDEIINHINDFILSCYEDIKLLTEKTIFENKNGKIKTLDSDFNTNTNEIEFFSNIIMKQIKNFNMKEILINTYKNLTKEDILTFYEKYILSTVKNNLAYIISIKPKF
jgi:insulysin